MEVVDLYAVDGKKSGSVTIPTEIRDFKPNQDAVYYSVKGYMGNQALHIARVKTRSDVKGGGSKPWRQKGTGRARAGTSRSPVWRGGGVVFGPSTAEHSSKVNRKTRKLALKSLIFWKIEEQKLKVLENLDFMDNEEKKIAKTKNVVAVLKALKVEADKVLLLMEEADDLLWKSARNIKNVKVKIIKNINVYDIINCEYILTSKKCLESIKEIF